jgi:hypothetical protein
MTRDQEIIERIRDVDYWDGNGSDLLDWVTLGYVERGDGRLEDNPGWAPFSCDSRSKPDRATTAQTGVVHESGDGGVSQSPRTSTTQAQEGGHPVLEKRGTSCNTEQSTDPVNCQHETMPLSDGWFCGKCGEKRGEHNGEI